jgi:hypothetical protein
VTIFDYSTAAELFAARSRRPMRQTIEYRRFASAADATRYAIEELRPALLAGAFWMSMKRDSTAMKFVDSTTAPIIRWRAARRCDSSKDLEECSDRGRWPRQA